MTPRVMSLYHLFIVKSIHKHNRLGKITIMNNITKYSNQLNVIGNKIKYYRTKRNLSQAGLSNKLLLLGIDIPKNSIQRIESGDRIIKDYELAGLSKVLKVSTDILLLDFFKELE